MEQVRKLLDNPQREPVIIITRHGHPAAYSRPWRSHTITLMPLLHYDITHTTTYRYKEPVGFGLHRVMFRPRDSHDLRVLATDLQVSPQASIRLIQDPYSNSVALVQPLGSATELRFVCTFRIEQVPAPGR